MKAILKKCLGSLKAAMVFAPLVVVAGGAIGTGIYFAVDGVDKINTVMAELENVEVYQETQKKDLEELNQLFQNRQITRDEYNLETRNVGNLNYASEFLKSNEEFEEYEKSLSTGNNEFFGGLFGGILGGTLLGAFGVAMYYNFRYDIKDFISGDFKEASEIAVTERGRQIRN